MWNQLKKAFKDEVTKIVKQPWQMTQDEFLNLRNNPYHKEESDDYEVLYHTVKTRYGENIDEKIKSIAKEGLRIDRGVSNGPGLLWAATTATGYNDQNPVVEFRVRKDDPKIRGYETRSSHREIERDILPEEIISIHVPHKLPNGTGQYYEKRSDQIAPDEQYTEQLKKWRGNSIEEALKEGKDIPQNVLEEYQKLKGR